MLKDHIKTVKRDDLTTGYIVSCSCGDKWSVSRQQFADGADGYDKHVKEKTGKFPIEHD